MEVSSAISVSAISSSDTSPSENPCSLISDSSDAKSLVVSASSLEKKLLSSLAESGSSIWKLSCEVSSEETDTSGSASSDATKLSEKSEKSSP